MVIISPLLTITLPLSTITSPLVPVPKGGRNSLGMRLVFYFLFPLLACCHGKCRRKVYVHSTFYQSKGRHGGQHTGLTITPRHQKISGQ